MSLKKRWLIVVLVLMTAVFAIIPNFTQETSETKDHWYLKNRMTYGLDIQGGLHLVLGVNLKEAFRDRLQKYLNSFKQEMGAKVASSQVVDSSKVLITFKSASDIQNFERFVEETYPGSFFVDSLQGNSVHILFTEVFKGQVRQQILDQSVEVIRNRVDEFGVSEPVITPQGRDRIVVQLPGVSNAASAKELIQKAAKLELRPLHQKNAELDLESLITEFEKKEKVFFKDLPYSAYIRKINASLKDKLPKDGKLIFEQLPGAKSLEAGRQPVLIDMNEVVGGELLENAQVSFDQYGSPVVVFSMSPQGGKLFGDLTTKHVGHQVAIILDQVVKSAPNITEPITSGNVQITLGRGNQDEIFKEAQLIAAALRAGALPAEMEELQERTIGPSLGRVALEKGKLAAIIGSILLLIFMIFYYGIFGIIANFALIFNMLLLFGVLSGFKATLTLPGIVGFLLTVGMAVDANVIIYERIKEELRKGSSLAFSVKEGFEKAFSSIFDSNITTIMVCIILMYLGSGPIRGFAVTLCAGVVISMFTALFVSRTLILSLIYKNPSLKWGLK